MLVPLQTSVRNVIKIRSMPNFSGRRLERMLASRQFRNGRRSSVRIQTATKEETRKRRIEQFVAMLAEGKTLH